MRIVLKWMAILLIALLPVTALAQSQEEFALSCTVKTAQETELYVMTQTNDEAGAVVADYAPLTTLAADTPLRLTGAKNEARGLRECWYYADGAAHKAWVASDALTTATVTFYLDDGAMLMLSESLVQDEAALAAYFADRYPGREYSTTPPPPPPPAPIVPDAWVSAAESAMAEENMPVKVLQLGLTEASVEDEAHNVFSIPTDQLIFADGVDAAHRVAVIHAPRTGSASLRENADGSGKKLEACATGRIVPVLEYGKSFTRVRYEGREGWVMTDALQFFPGGGEPLGMGTLHFKGKTDGENVIKIYTTASTSSAQVAGLKTGVTVTVLSHSGVWYAVEHEGWYGYVNQQNLTMEGE